MIYGASCIFTRIFLSMLHLGGGAVLLHVRSGRSGRSGRPLVDRIFPRACI